MPEEAHFHNTSIGIKKYAILLTFKLIGEKKKKDFAFYLHTHTHI